MPQRYGWSSSNIAVWRPINPPRGLVTCIASILEGMIVWQVFGLMGALTMNQLLLATTSHSRMCSHEQCLYCGFRSHLPLRGSSGITPDSLSGPSLTEELGTSDSRRVVSLAKELQALTGTHWCFFDSDFPQ